MNARGGSGALNVVVEPELDGRTPFVLVHGVGSNLTAWDDVAAALARHAPVVRYDLRGHGGSPRRDVPYRLDDFVADHAEVMAGLGIDRAHLVGFSLGGLIAQAVALRAPKSVDRLVLVGAVAGRTPEERTAVSERLGALRRSGGAPTNAERWFSPQFLREHPERVAANLARQATADPDGYAAAYEVLATNDLVEELARIGAPTLAMTGEFDVGSPPHMSRTIAERVRDGRVVILAGRKHAVLDEIPDRVATEILHFTATQTRGVAS